MCFFSSLFVFTEGARPHTVASHQAVWLSVTVVNSASDSDSQTASGFCFTLQERENVKKKRLTTTKTKRTQIDKYADQLLLHYHFHKH